MKNNTQYSVPTKTRLMFIGEVREIHSKILAAVKYEDYYKVSVDCDSTDMFDIVDGSFTFKAEETEWLL